MDADDVAADSSGEALDAVRLPSGAARIIGSFQQPAMSIGDGRCAVRLYAAGDDPRSGRGHVI